MDRMERLCPACRAANAMDRARCHACGADIMSHLPAPVESRLPVPWKQVGASLTFSVGALALRGGLRLAKHLWEKRTQPTERRVQPHSPGKVRSWLARRGEAQPAPGPQPQVKVWGRRVWGKWERDGSGQLEVQEFYWQTPGSES
jgi:hypothetical protein